MIWIRLGISGVWVHDWVDLIPRKLEGFGVGAKRLMDWNL